MDDPKISIIVPNYNHASYLRLRLESIFNQTFQDFEVIILDDCSTDNSKEIIEGYRNHPQVSHIVYNETNCGSPFKQWAKGFDLAQGEYIWIAESDDWAEPTFLQELLPILESDSTIAVAFCNSYNENGRIPTSVQNPFEKTRRINKKDMLKKYLSWKCVIYNASSALIRKKNVLNIDYDYQNFSSSGDYLFWIHMAEQGNIYYNQHSLNHYRIHNHNKSKEEWVTGKAFLEDLEIFHYKKTHNYSSFYNKHVTVLNYLNYINKQISKAPQNTLLLESQRLWRKEILSVQLSKFIVKLGQLIWIFFPRRHS